MRWRHSFSIFYVTAKEKRLCPFAWFRLNGHQHQEAIDRYLVAYTDRVICYIFNECFDNNEISLNLVRYIASIFRPFTCSVVTYRYGFGRLISQTSLITTEFRSVCDRKPIRADTFYVVFQIFPSRQHSACHAV